MAPTQKGMKKLSLGRAGTLATRVEVELTNLTARDLVVCAVVTLRP